MKKEENKKTNSPIFILVIFMVLILFVFLVPELYQKYNKEVADFLGIGSNSKEETKEEEKIEEMSDFYQIKENKPFDFNEIQISNVVLSSEGILSLKINSDENIDLEKTNYYIEFYKYKETFLGRRILKGEINDSINLEIDVKNLEIDESIYFTLSHISDNAIPIKDMTSDESGLSELICLKENVTYTYEFNLSKLIKVTLKEELNFNNVDDYTKLNYQKKANEYNELTGITASIIDKDNGFTFLSEFDFENIDEFKRINEEFIYKKNEAASFIDFKMDSEGYVCS